MKQSILTTAFIVFLSMRCITLHSQEKAVKENDTITCLKVIGLATENSLPVDGIQITMYRENEELEWDELTSVKNHDHRFTFNLLGNSYYSIEISKPGYNKRLIGISTVIPDDALFDGDIFQFEFDVELIKEIKGEDDYYLDFPIALIAYNTDDMVFENNANYTKHIKTKIDETAKASTVTSVQQKNNLNR